MKARILSAFLRLDEARIEIERFKDFGNYYESAWLAIKHGQPAEADYMGSFSDEHIQIIVEVISNWVQDGSACLRTTLRALLWKRSRFQADPKGRIDEDTLNRLIDFALRLWLVLNVRDEDFAPGSDSIQWNDKISLQDFVAGQFPKPRLMETIDEKTFLPDNFTVVKLREFSGIKVDWTYSLDDHLDLDRDHRILKIFPLKHYLQVLRKSDVEIIPREVIDEYMRTMNFLFPSWDVRTQKFLRKKQQTFGMEGPVDYPSPLYLSDFYFWRDRLSTLYREFRSPPPSMTQLWNDRRNVLQWYTFWFAVLILGLTVIFGLISSILGGLQARYAYQALVIARDGVSANACPPVTCGSGSASSTF